MNTSENKPRFSSTGKRKTAIARIYLYENGNGTIEVNSEKFEAYFPRRSDQLIIQQPLSLTKTETTFDIYANVSGGGKAGQADAVKYGIAKALLQFNPEFRKILKSNDLLTRDSRIVERKKAGLAGARKRFQYSKR